MHLFHSRPARGRKTFAPRLEVLESRNLLCTITVNSPVLTITGDNAADQVTITDNGTGGPQSIKVQCGNQTQVIVPPITTIKVKTGGGADSVRYLLPNGLQAGVVRKVQVDLGDSTDVFSSLFRGEQQAKSLLQVDVRGGESNDLLAANAVQDSIIRPGAQMFVHLDGGGGNDRVSANYPIQLDGLLCLDLNGGSGNDRVSADVALGVGSTGVLSCLTHPAMVQGGTGDDHVRFVVHNLGTAVVQAKMDGGPDKDVGAHTANVPSANVEVDSLVP